MARIPVPLARQYGARVSRTVSSEMLINWYATTTETHGGKQTVLYQRPGLKFDATIGIGPHRGALVHDGVLYMVSGSGFYRMTSTGVVSFLGSLNTFSGRVGMASNGTQLIVVDGQDGWIFNSVTLVFVQITDLDFVDAQQVVFFHGRFVVIKPNTGEFYISSLYNGLTWAALDFAVAEIDPDDLKALIVSHQELWLLGDVSSEAYVDVGNALFPFERQPGGFIEWGIAAKWSVAKGDNTVIWLAKTRDGHGNVVKATGFSPQIISDDSLEEAISLYSRIDDAYAYVIKPNDKNLWYVLTFPSANVTWVYDLSTNLWHQWSSYGVGRFKGATHCFFNNKHYIGSDVDGKLYQFDTYTYADDNDPLERVATTIHIGDRNRLFWHSLEILFDAGVGLATGQGSDPQAMLRFSNDGGYTFGNSHWRSIGKIGEYGMRALWKKLGQSRHRVYELRVTDPVNAVVIGAYAEVGKGYN